MCMVKYVLLGHVCLCKHMCVWWYMYVCACMCAGQRKPWVLFLLETSTLGFEAVSHWPGIHQLA